jgi:hypothetical protein
MGKVRWLLIDPFSRGSDSGPNKHKVDHDFFWNNWGLPAPTWNVILS